MKLFRKGKIPRRFWRRFTRTKLYNYLPDKTAVKIKYRNNFLKKLDLKNPQTFNEKLQWLKLYDRKPIYTQMVDKLAAKEHVARIIGEEYVVPLLGAWDSFDDIDFDSLPNRFVLKCTHASGDTVICRDKAQFDRDKAKSILQTSLERDYYLISREWPYKNVKRRIIAEKYMEEDDGTVLTDYKFFCFNGVPKMMYISKDKAEDTRTDFFDMDFHHLDLQMRDKGSEVLPCKPAFFDKMRKLAECLCADFPFIRIDFYYVGGQIYFGEYTFFHCSGLSPVKPDKWDRILGDWIILPEKYVQQKKSK